MTLYLHSDGIIIQVIFNFFVLVGYALYYLKTLCRKCVKSFGSKILKINKFLVKHFPLWNNTYI